MSEMIQTNHPEKFTGIHYLAPQKTFIHLGSQETLHVTIQGDRIYAGVWASYLFPISSPMKYITLHYPTGEGDKEAEVGVIRDLNEFPEEARQLVTRSLDKQYYVPRIQRIHDIQMEYGFLDFDVETDKGPRKFLMKWQAEKGTDYGDTGKMLIDVNGNLYLVEDVNDLTEDERLLFTRFVYW
ncbi:DUF1854 domain-containing protein [Kamptonema cortianum]|nr:DUF1854 domain-containing protein [Kamptonema cortianum]MDL5046174.1 DUF1854 domain-containing protein [Oscillatoria amoena NRMC-F 0135]